MNRIEQFLQNNNLVDADDIDSLIEMATLLREMIDNHQCDSISELVRYTLESCYHEAFSWCMGILQENLEKEKCPFPNFECNIGKSISNFDAFIECLQVDLKAYNNRLETVYDKNGEVESFYNIFTYVTAYKNIFLVSSENFDTKDNDFVQYKLVFVKR